jgi:hypothetical protein
MGGQDVPDTATLARGLPVTTLWERAAACERAYSGTAAGALVRGVAPAFAAEHHEAANGLRQLETLFQAELFLGVVGPDPTQGVPVAPVVDAPRRELTMRIDVAIRVARALQARIEEVSAERPPRRVGEISWMQEQLLALSHLISHPLEIAISDAAARQQRMGFTGQERENLRGLLEDMARGEDALRATTQRDPNRRTPVEATIEGDAPLRSAAIVISMEHIAGVVKGEGPSGRKPA